MRFEAERKVTNRGEGPDETATARARTRWNYSNGIHETRQLLDQNWGSGSYIHDDTFSACYASFSFLTSSHLHRLLSSSIIYYIFLLYIIYSHNVDFFFYHPLLRTIVFYSLKFSKHRIRFLIASLKFSTLDQFQTGNISIGFRPRDGKALFISARSFPFPEEKKSQGSFREQI